MARTGVNITRISTDKGGTDRTDITGTKRTEMDCVASLKWHRSNRNAWHYDTEMGGTKRTEVSKAYKFLHNVEVSYKIALFDRESFRHHCKLANKLGRYKI